MKTQFEFIHFEQVLGTKARTTQVWSCHTNRSCAELGEVKWYGPWRQYCYFPSAQAVYSAGCLADIQTFIGQLEAERKQGMPVSTANRGLGAA